MTICLIPLWKRRKGQWERATWRAISRVVRAQDAGMAIQMLGCHAVGH